MLTNLRFSFRFGAFRRPEKTTSPCRRDVPAACAAPPDGADAPRRPAERNKSADRKNGQPSRNFCQPSRISCQPAIDVARRGAIYDARCPWGHKVSAAFRAVASAFFAAFRVVSPVIRASQVAPLRFLYGRLWVAAAGHLADLRRLQSRQSIWQFSLTVRPPRLHGTMWSASMNVSSISLPQRAHRPPCSS